MWKKVSLSVIIICIGLLIFYYTKSNKEDSEDIFKNEIYLSNFVTDECIDEWKEYSLTVQDELNQASTTLTDENKTYILREKNGYINLYYLNEKKEEILYKVTEISTKYLEKEDILKLEKRNRSKRLAKCKPIIRRF